MNFGTPEIQRQILMEIQQLNYGDSLQGAFKVPRTWITGEVAMDEVCVQTLYLTLEGLKAPPHLLGTIGSWGDTLEPEAVLEQLRSWNHRDNGRQVIRRIKIPEQ